MVTRTPLMSLSDHFLVPTGVPSDPQSPSKLNFRTLFNRRARWRGGRRHLDKINCHRKNTFEAVLGKRAKNMEKQMCRTRAKNIWTNTYIVACELAVCMTCENTRAKHMQKTCQKRAEDVKNTKNHILFTLLCIP